MNFPTPLDDLIDSRDVTAAIEDLETDIELGDLEADDDEYTSLKDLEQQGETQFGEWNWGAVLIAESYFPSYVETLAQDTVEGFKDNEETWPYSCIDWERAAEELSIDYTVMEWEGQAFYVR